MGKRGKMSKDEEKFEEEFVFDFEIEEEEVQRDKKTENPVKQCIEFIQESKKGFSRDDLPYLISEDDKRFKIDEDRIYKLTECEDFRTLGFVDGGNAPLVKSADFTISLNRVAGVLFKNKAWTQTEHIPDKIEFYSATILKPNESGELEFETRFFPKEKKQSQYLPKNKIQLPLKEALDERGNMPNIERFSARARRFAEWTFAKEFVSQELGSGDIFVRDGSLQTGYKDEIELAEQLYQAALKKNVYITGLSKTCRLLTARGDSLISVINLIANKKYPNAQWYYHPIYKITKADNQADIYFLKLHKYSHHPFRFDIYLEQAEKLEDNQKEIDTIISNVAHVSNDLSFPGYPYGLIKVDQMSRIAYRELDSQKLMVISEFEKDIYDNYIRPRLNSINVHDIINEIRK